ncbi:MAG: hypothetical protein MJ126_01500 [Lachnospiraceae bacterium]|nr:hypothetical protein [Lachnospiraceae bacterium]
MSIWDEVDALDEKIRRGEEAEEVVENTEVEEEIIPEPEIEFKADNNEVYEIKIEKVPKANHAGVIKAFIFLACGAVFAITVIAMVITLSNSGREVREFEKELDSFRVLQSHSINEADLSGGVGIVWDKLVESD